MNSDDWRNKSVALGKLGRHEEAIKAYDKAIKLDPKNAEAWRNKGVALGSLRRHEEAIKAYGKAIELDPKNAEAGRNWCEEAIKAYDKAIKLDPKNAEAWRNKGVALGKLGRHKEAIKAYDKAIKLDPKNAKDWMYKGIALGDLKRHEEAIEAYDKAIDLDTKNAEVWRHKGIALGNLKRHEEAIEAYDKAIDLDPNNAITWKYKGIALGIFEGHEEAIEAYDKAIELDTNNAIFWGHKGFALGKLGRHEEAIEAYDKAIELDPKNAEAWGYKGIALGDLKRHEEAIEAYNKAIELDPKNILANSYFGELFFNRGNIKGASKKVEELLKIDNRIAQVNGFRLQGKIRIEEQNYNDAAESFRKAISLNVDDTGLLLLEVDAIYLNAEYSSNQNDRRYNEKIVSIIRKLERAEKLTTKNGNKEDRIYILYFLGYYYYKIRNFYTARKKLEECIELKPEIPIKPYTKELLNNIWNQMKKPGLDWWLYSTSYYWIKRIMLTIILLVIACILILFLIHPFISSWFPSLQINFTLYIYLIITLIIVLMFPSIESIKAEGLEINILSPPPLNEFVFPSSIIADYEDKNKN